MAKYSFRHKGKRLEFTSLEPRMVDSDRIRKAYTELDFDTLNDARDALQRLENFKHLLKAKTVQELVWVIIKQDGLRAYPDDVEFEGKGYKED